MLEECKVKMRAGRQSGRAHVADHLAHSHVAAGPEVVSDPAKMPIDTHKTVLVIQSNAAPKFTRPIRALHLPVRNRLYGRAVFRDQVHSNVRTVAMQNRMVASISEARGYIF